MTNDDYILSLTYLYGGSGFGMIGDGFDGLVWMREEPRPTKEQVEAALPFARAARMREIVDQDRRSAYVNTADPVFLKWQRGEATEQDWLDAVEAVKVAYPWPES